MQPPDYYLTDRRRIERFMERVVSRNNYLHDHIIILEKASCFLGVLATDEGSESIVPAILADVLWALLRSHIEILNPQRLQLPSGSLPEIPLGEPQRALDVSDQQTAAAIHAVFDAMLCLYDSLHAARGVFCNVLESLRRMPVAARSVESISQQSDLAAALSVMDAATLMAGSVAHVQLRRALGKAPNLAADLVARLRNSVSNTRGRVCAMALHLLAPFVDRIESHGKGFVEVHLSAELEQWVGAQRSRSFGIDASLDEIIRKDYADLSPYFRINKQVLVNDWNMEGIRPALARRGGVVQPRKERFYVQTKRMDRSIYLDGYRDVFEARNVYLRLPLRSGEHMASTSGS